MDPALALAQAYLQINGYFTVTDYPVVEAVPEGYRSATDLDILAVRLPGAGHLVVGRDEPGQVFEADPVLGAPNDGIHLVIAEVKQGLAELNRGAREPRILATAISRFGACPPGEAERLAGELVECGTARHEDATIQMVAFGTRAKRIPTSRSAPSRWATWPTTSRRSCGVTGRSSSTSTSRIRRLDSWQLIEKVRERKP